MSVSVIWNNVFIDSGFYYKQGEEAFACADGLSGWALCMSGNKVPELFGRGMVKISSFLGISATPDSLNKYADKILIKRSKDA